MLEPKPALPRFVLIAVGFSVSCARSRARALERFSDSAGSELAVETRSGSAHFTYFVV
jgi:hypothetical protein